MPGEPNQKRWVGIRPTDPAETIPVSVAPGSSEVEVVQDTAADLKATVIQDAKDRTVTNPTAANLKAEVGQPTAANLKATVTQDAKDRTVTNPTAANLKAEVVPKKVASGTYNQVSVSTTATGLVTANSSRIAVIVKNISSTPVYVGLDGSVTTSNGLLLEQGDSLEFTTFTGSIVGITPSGTATIAYMEV